MTRNATLEAPTMTEHLRAKGASDRDAQERGASYQQCTGSKQIRHVGCGGQVCPSGRCFVKVGIGVGYAPGSERLQAEYAEFEAYMGFCRKCKAHGDFVRVDRKSHVVTQFV